MADIASSGVTITCLPTDRFNLGKLRMNMVKIEFGNGTDTVPSGGGVPLPAVGAFGMNKFLKALMIYGGKGTYEYSFSQTDHKLFVYHGDYSASSDGPHVDAGGVAITARTLYALAIGQ